MQCAHASFGPIAEGAHDSARMTEISYVLPVHLRDDRLNTVPEPRLNRF